MVTTQKYQRHPLCRYAALPPKGGSEKSAPERGAAAAAAEGCGRHPSLYKIPGEFVTAPLASPGGKLDFLAIGTSEPIDKKD